MLLELGKAGSFFLSLLSLYPVLVSAFFVQGSRWEERLMLALGKVVVAGCVCLASGLVFTWPSRGNPEAGKAITSTLPVKVFLWAAPGMMVLFLVSWYLMCAGGCLVSSSRDCL
jgi:hypothetical protein